MMKLNEPQIDEIRAYLLEGEDLRDDDFDMLYEYFCNNGEMPYDVAKARSGDPYEWITEKLLSTLTT